MNYQSMEYFMAAAEEGSFTAGARKLHITQQTLSAGILHLEEELGSRLFERTHPLGLTYAGTVFYSYAEEFLGRYETMQKQFANIAGGNEGVLRIGVGYTRGRMLMPTLIALFQKEYPHIRVELCEGSADQMKRQLIDYEIDLAVANFTEMEGALSFFPFYNEEILLFVSKSLLERTFPEDWQTRAKAAEAGDLSALEGCPFVMSLPEDTTGTIARYFLKKYGMHSDIKAMSDNLETLLALCVQEVGACFCPRNLAAMTLPEDSLEKLYRFPLSEEARYHIRFAVRRNEETGGLTGEFMRIAGESGIVAEPDPREN